MARCSGWRKHLARIATDADDIVPLCWKGKAEQALLRLAQTQGKLKLRRCPSIRLVAVPGIRFQTACQLALERREQPGASAVHGGFCCSEASCHSSG
jgi:hypothetical protein